MDSNRSDTKLTTHWREEFERFIHSGIQADSLPMPSKGITERIIRECFDSEDMKEYDYFLKSISLDYKRNLTKGKKHDEL